MRKYIIAICLTAISAIAAQSEYLNIAKVEYGAKSDFKNIIDNDEKTYSKIESFVVKLSTETILSKIDLKMKPARGILFFKSKLNNKDVYLEIIEVTEKDDYVSFNIIDNFEYEEITVVWVPSEKNTKLEVKEFGAYTSDKEMIKLYKQVAIYLAKNVTPESKIGSDGAEELVIKERNVILPKNLPTEYVISPAVIPESKPLSK